MLGRRIWGFLIVVVVAISIAVFINVQYYSDPASAFNRSKNNVLPVINPSDVNPKLVDTSLLVNTSLKDKTENHTIGDFSFLDQRGREITKSDVAGKIYVTDFFFTTCGGICPKMTTQLQRIQKEFNNDENIMILSHTVNPSYDSVAVMYGYAERFKANHNQWLFLTGDKKELYLMARKSYIVVPDETDTDFEHGGESDFLHTENFALIDPIGRIRGMYDGTNPEEIADLIYDIYDLKKEYKLP